MTVRGSHIALCLAVALGGVALTPALAEAKGCADHMFATIYMQSPNRSAIPKTRRIQRGRKLRAPTPLASDKPKQAIVLNTNHVKVTERDYNPDAIDALVLEWLAFDVLIDDPRRYSVFELRVVRPLLAILAPEVAPQAPPTPEASSKLSELRVRLLPKLPASNDDSLFA